jgi:integrase
VVADRKDEDERAPFDDDDVKKIRANLHKLDSAHQLLLRVLATTGMRRGEAFEIASEKTEDGIRYCEVGTKTPQSRRRVPLPKALLPHLPKTIIGPLFTGRKDTASKRLREFMHEIGITDPDKAPMHSFRHRAANRLRRAGVPEDLREAIGGWADGKKKTSRKYGNKHGRGFPIKMLKTAIDKIGF